MQLDPLQRSRRAEPTERLALLVFFGALLAVLAILGAARTAHAAEGPASPEPGLQLAEEEWELGEEECLEAEPEEEIEAACEEEEEAEACPLRSAHAHLAERHGQLKLTIGYTTNEPTAALVKVQNGATKSFKRQLNRSGVLRLTEPTGKPHTKVVIDIAAVGWAGCPSRRLVLFRH